MPGLLSDSDSGYDSSEPMPALVSESDSSDSEFGSPAPPRPQFGHEEDGWAAKLEYQQVELADGSWQMSLAFNEHAIDVPKKGKKRQGVSDVIVETPTAGQRAQRICSGKPPTHEMRKEFLRAYRKNRTPPALKPLHGRILAPCGERFVFGSLRVRC